MTYGWLAASTQWEQYGTITRHWRATSKWPAKTQVEMTPRGKNSPPVSRRSGACYSRIASVSRVRCVLLSHRIAPPPPVSRRSGACYSRHRPPPPRRRRSGACYSRIASPPPPPRQSSVRCVLLSHRTPPRRSSVRPHRTPPPPKKGPPENLGIVRTLVIC